MAFRRRLSAAWYAFNRPHLIASTPGIELRILCDGQTVVHADSDLLYFLGKYGGLCDGEGWADVLWDLVQLNPYNKSLRVEVRSRKVDRP